MSDDALYDIAMHAAKGYLNDLRVDKNSSKEPSQHNFKTSIDNLSATNTSGIARTRFKNKIYFILFKPGSKYNFQRFNVNDNRVRDVVESPKSRALSKILNHDKIYLDEEKDLYKHNLYFDFHMSDENEDHTAWPDLRGHTL